MKRQDGWNRCVVWVLAWMLAGGCGLLPTVGFAQEESDAARAERRQRQFEELAREVRAMERQLTLLRRVASLVKPSVVHIEASAANRRLEEAGGGVLVGFGQRNFVITNRHVIKHSTLRTVEITLADGRILKPIQMWSDPGTDIAVLELRAEKLVHARVGDSSKMEIGDFVLAVGSPFGLSQSVTFGIISAKGRRDLQLGDDRVRFQDFLQTDAAINPGNSGGPLINLRGEVIGINTAIASSSGGSEGIGFTIPINMAMIVARQLTEQGRVSRAYLGVHLDRDFDAARSSLEYGLSRPKGARVSGITPQSPAASARIRVNDVIVKVGKRWVEDDDHLINMVSLTPVGSEIELTIIRKRQPMRLRIRVGDRNRFEPEDRR